MRVRELTDMAILACSFVILSSAAVAQTNTFPASGNVGIGTTSPLSPLHVLDTGGNDAGVVRIEGNTLPSLTLVQTGIHGFSEFVDTANNDNFAIAESDVGVTGSTRLFNITTGGNVGIGTTSPVVGTLSVQTPNNIASLYLANSNLDPAWSPPLASMVLGSLAVGANRSGGQVETDFINAYASGYTGGFTFYGNNLSTNTITPLLSMVGSTGNMGIGTTSPGAKLEVDGNVKLTSGSGASITFADGTVQSTAYTGVSCGGDFAESVDVTGKRKLYAPGDVLVIDPQHPGEFLEASQPYSTLVAGIYSTKPGFVGRRLTGPKGADEVPMAMVGIVPTKVTAENGPIHTGDLLVTSSVPGRAMKGTDPSRLTGAVVGKALGNLDSGTGTIEVLVTLQ